MAAWRRRRVNPPGRTADHRHNCQSRKENAVLNHQGSGIGTVTPSVPAKRVLASEFLENLNGLPHVFAFGIYANVLVVNPLQAVAGDFVPQALEFSG